MIELVILAFAAYAVTFVVTESRLTEWFRGWFNANVPFKSLFVGDADESLPFIKCRMCVGFWASLAICLAFGDSTAYEVLAVYGLSYFLATQER